ncbi:MAG: hypothetical protein LBV71_14155 [Prevotella sp.]|jgi:hypothetical protein|nr:hypothetical protein [Prevotella sp.]
MNKIIYSILAMALLITSCSPIESDETLGGILSVDGIKATVKGITPGSNKIVLVNETPGTAVYWDYVAGISTRQSDTVALPFLGTQNIKLTALCAGGQVTKEFPVTIEQIDYPVDPTWSLFAGDTQDGKTWVWDTSVPWAGPYGTGGYGTSPRPDWGGIENITNLPAHNGISPDQEMKFDLNGGPNFTKLTLSGEVLEEGTFSFSMYTTPQPTLPDMGYPWAVGKLTFTGATVLSGFGWDDTKGTTPIYVFDIVSLTDDTMVLAYAPSGTEFGNWMAAATMWCFKKK